MKAITLWQPWASLVAFGVKQYETRSWSTRHRGPLAIHAAAQPVNMDTITPEVNALCLELLGFHPTRLQRGEIVGVVDVVDVRRTHDWLASGEITTTELAAGDWRPGRFAWKLENARRFEEPIQIKGAQGLWDWDPPGEILRYL